jgi:hypothetical protein
VSSVITRTRIDEDNQEQALDRLLGFDVPKGAWRIQRPDGQYFSGCTSLGVYCFTPKADLACPFHTEASARRLLDIFQGSAAGRMAMRDCRPVCVLPLLPDGDHVPCACGMFHEADYCPTANGHGAVL